MFIFGLLVLLVSVVMFFVLPKVLNREFPSKLVSAGGLTLGLILMLFSTFTVVSAGQRGVVVLFGDVREVTLNEGLHLINPLASVVEMSARVEKDSEKQVAETSDTQSVTITTIINWQPEADKLAVLYKHYGWEFANKIIPPAMQEAVKAEVAKHKVSDLIASRPQIRQAVQNVVKEWLKKYHVELLEVAIADIDFSEKYDQAIEAKQVEEQRAQQKLYELQRTRTEAEMAAAAAKGEADSKIARARGDAESVKLSAQAEADALRIRAEAQQDYNTKVGQSLSPLLVQIEWLKRWEGKLPQYLMGGDSSTTMMVPLPSKDQK